MHHAGLRAKTCRRFRVNTTDSGHKLPVAANLLDRQFRPAAKHQAWTMDITYVPTDEGWLYLALVEDLYSRKVVGWSMSERIDSTLAADALAMAVRHEQPQPGLLAHSDRGVQYASDHFQQLLAEHGITCSMSRKANCWDNAPAESLIATIKKELVHQTSYATRDAGATVAVRVHRGVLQSPASALGARLPNATRHPSSQTGHREEGRGGSGERGRVSPEIKNKSRRSRST